MPCNPCITDFTASCSCSSSVLLLWHLGLERQVVRPVLYNFRCMRQCYITLCGVRVPQIDIFASKLTFLRYSMCCCLFIYTHIPKLSISKSIITSDIMSSSPHRQGQGKTVLSCRWFERK